ncbi:MAG: MBL fold metallo-hydrolase [Ignavibacteriaceae bacterium]|nr:MBL fold metallo-hydrolase [Ignavibacteriaceae bacterium]NUM69980.1 MBL fold metallo-hydrolase [Ignavibacteriaceae bacterium]
MKVKIWGARGSIPTPLTASEYRRKVLKILTEAAKADLSSESRRIEFFDGLEPALAHIVGGNTSCVEVNVNDTIIVFDMGSGFRELGNNLLRRNLKDKNIYVFLSHTHWDHIQGFPFFKPAFMKDFHLHFRSPHGNLRQKLIEQQEFRFFPVSLDYMASDKHFYDYAPGQDVEINGIKIRNIELHHPGKSYGYRVEFEGKSMVFATDSEYNNFNSEKFNKYINFYRDSDLLIFDAQYSFDQEIQRIDWGHSSALVGVDLAETANVKRLALFHHEPDNDDFEVCKLYKAAIEYKNKNYADSNLEVFLAREDVVIEL